LCHPLKLGMEIVGAKVAVSGSHLDSRMAEDSAQSAAGFESDRRCSRPGQGSARPGRPHSPPQQGHVTTVGTYLGGPSFCKPLCCYSRRNAAQEASRETFLVVCSAESEPRER
jgi:hypothetical protein